MSSSFLDNLHDATLLSVHLDWETGNAVFTLRTGLPAPKHLAITAIGTSDLRCPRRAPWGASASINEVRGPTAHEDQEHLELEMQSGDVLRISARSLTCSPCAAPA